MDTGTALFTRAVERLPEDGLDAATRLPGWSRRHVIAHVSLNAEALGRLVRWAIRRATPMYASAGQRARDIEDALNWPNCRPRSFVESTAAQLAADLDLPPQDRWTAEVVTAQGRTVAATEIVWMRTREVAVHAVDLAAGVDFEDLPEELCVALITDITRLRSARGHDPALQLSFGDHTWPVAGDWHAGPDHGSPAALARWLAGRGTFGLVIRDDRSWPGWPWMAVI